MKAKKIDKQERLKRAAIVKMKYQIMAGKLDDGFKTVYEGVLQDLELEESEVDEYIVSHERELKGICNA